MEKQTRFVVKFNSRRDATLFHNSVQKEIKKETAYETFTEYDSVVHWSNEGGLFLTIFFKDPLTIDQAKKFTSFESQWRFLPSTYCFSDLLNMNWY